MDAEGSTEEGQQTNAGAASSSGTDSNAFSPSGLKVRCRPSAGPALAATGSQLLQTGCACREPGSLFRPHGAISGQGAAATKHLLLDACLAACRSWWSMMTQCASRSCRLCCSGAATKVSGAADGLRLSTSWGCHFTHALWFIGALVAPSPL